MHGQVERARIGGARQGRCTRMHRKLQVGSVHGQVKRARIGGERVSVRASEVRGRVGAHARIGSDRWGRCMARLSVRASEAGSVHTRASEVMRGGVGAHACIGSDRWGRCTARLSVRASEVRGRVSAHACIGRLHSSGVHHCQSSHSRVFFLKNTKSPVCGV